MNIPIAASARASAASVPGSKVGMETVARVRFSVVTPSRTVVMLSWTKVSAAVPLVRAGNWAAGIVNVQGVGPELKQGSVWRQAKPTPLILLAWQL